MRQKSLVLFEDQHYVACLVANRTILTVQRKRDGEETSGKAIEGDLAKEWSAAFETADDASESRALCRAVLSA